jgi:hypothetical protein
MSSNPTYRIQLGAKKEWPIKPGSALYRALEMIAQKIVLDLRNTTSKSFEKKSEEGK